MKKLNVIKSEEIDLIDFLDQHLNNLETKQQQLKSEKLKDQVEGRLMGHEVKFDFVKWFINLLLKNLLNNILYKKVIYQQVTYDSVNPQGNPCKLTGLIIYPKFNGSQVKLPIIGYNHATQMVRDLAPSCFNPKKPLDYMEAIVGLFFAAQYGYIVSMADYQGLGGDNDNMHPYVNCNPLAQSVIDLLDVTRDFIKDKNIIWNNQLYLIGYSEGGYVTMATSRMIQENSKYSGIYTIRASSPMGGPYSISEVMRFVMLRKEKFGDGYFLPMTLRGFNAVYGNTYGDGIFTKEKSLKPQWQFLWDLADGYHTPEEVNEKMPPVPGDILSDEMVSQLRDSESIVYKVLKENDLINWQCMPSMPMHLYHAENDDRVPFENSVVIKAAFQKQGEDVPLVPLFHLPEMKSIHLGAALPGFLEGYYWFSSIRNTHNNRLPYGEYIVNGYWLESDNTLYRLRFQMDGNLALYKMDTDILLWETKTSFDHGICLMQTDGNFVVYDNDFKVQWQTNTKGEECVLSVEDSGTIEIKDKNGMVIWHV